MLYPLLVYGWLMSLFEILPEMSVENQEHIEI